MIFGDGTHLKAAAVAGNEPPLFTAKLKQRPS